MKKNNQNPKTVGALSKSLATTFKDQLSKSDVNEILAFVLNLEYDQILKMVDLELDHKQLKKLQKILIKISKGKPVGYLLGHKFFFKHDFLVDKGVLIPREDSEILVEEAIDFLEKAYPTQKARVVDLGTGTGNLGLMIAYLRKSQDEYLLTDISSKALKNAAKNVSHLKLNGNQIKIEKANFVKAFENNLPANLIVSNPPYIDKKDPDLAKNVKKYEPHQALFAKHKGLFFYELMAKNYSLIVDTNRPFMILMEFGYEQKDAIKKLFASLPNNHKIEFLKDNKGKWRAFKLYNK